MERNIHIVSMGKLSQFSWKYPIIFNPPTIREISPSIYMYFVFIGSEAPLHTSTFTYETLFLFHMENMPYFVKATFLQLRAFMYIYESIILTLKFDV